MRLRPLAISIWILLAAALPAAAADQPPARGSSYVPLDSWIYPALDRLAALGMIRSQISGLRPWTRAECRRQVLEAAGRGELAGEAVDTVQRLLTQFDADAETGGVVLES